MDSIARAHPRHAVHVADVRCFRLRLRRGEGMREMMRPSSSSCCWHVIDALRAHRRVLQPQHARKAPRTTVRTGAGRWRTAAVAAAAATTRCNDERPVGHQHQPQRLRVACKALGEGEGETRAVRRGRGRRRGGEKDYYRAHRAVRRGVVVVVVVVPVPTSSQDHERACVRRTQKTKAARL